MCNFNLFAMMLACGAGESLVNHFNANGNVPGRLVSSTIENILSGLAMLLPSVQRGSALALVMGYLLIGLLICAVMVLVGFSRLPVGFGLFKVPAVDRVSNILLPILGAGLTLLFKNALSLILALSLGAAKLLLGFILVLVAGLTCGARRQVLQLQGC
jgi:hypothetical protein